MAKLSEIPFHLTRVDIGGRPRLVCYGELDIVSSTRLHEALQGVIDTEESKIVRLDLANVTFIDSGGLGTLVAADRHLRERGGRLKIVAVSERIANVFEMSGLNRRFDLDCRTVRRVGSLRSSAPIITNIRDRS